MFSVECTGIPHWIIVMVYIQAMHRNDQGRNDWIVSCIGVCIWETWTFYLVSTPAQQSLPATAAALSLKKWPVEVLPTIMIPFTKNAWNLVCSSVEFSRFAPSCESDKILFSVVGCSDVFHRKCKRIASDSVFVWVALNLIFLFRWTTLWFSRAFSLISVVSQWHKYFLRS